VRGIEQVPALYDAGLALLEATGLGRWRRWLASEATGRVLDLGCGTGRNLPLYDGRVRVVGLDPCLETLQAARRRAAAVPLVLGAAERLPFRAAAFDAVVSGLVFCSVEEPPRALAEVRRVLAPGGTLRMLEHVRATSRLHARLQDAFQPLWTRLTGGCRPNRDTEAAVRMAEFRIDQGSRRASGAMRRFVARP
jgi:ubiquinone/menaquinone biosynthesis C-methylase UbiE